MAKITIKELESLTANDAGLTCVHYGAYADLPEAEAIRAEIRRQQPVLEEYGIHLLVSPTPYGELIIGDSRE